MIEKGGKNIKLVVNDISEGFITVNPIFLKPFNENSLKALFKAIGQKQTEIRAEPFPHHDIIKIRQRNIKLQRLYTSLMIVRNYAREKRIALF